MISPEIKGAIIGIYGIVFICWLIFKNWQSLKKEIDLGSDFE